MTTEKGITPLEERSISVQSKCNRTALFLLTELNPSSLPQTHSPRAVHSAPNELDSSIRCNIAYAVPVSLGDKRTSIVVQNLDLRLE